ncbi:MAG: ribosomal protein S18-alanine N-acetyltransferase [Mariprofundaceae bacterium]|nr:ribosomal protein S18-alanine N-acetyltransferase [Mariprofundaceae bacterium]
MPDIRIRRGSLADLDAVYRLNIDAFPEAWSKQALQHAIAGDYELLVAESVPDGGQAAVLAGYLLSHDIMEEVHILQIAVQPGMRRQHIALQLSRALLAEKAAQPHMQRAILEVRASNTAAQRLYRKLGFRICGRRKDYYRPRPPSQEYEEALLMDRLLRSVQK